MHNQSENLINNINKNQDYSIETSNYIKVLTLIKDKVETKLKEIIPHPHRLKRGLINGLGSIFKSITGNLDATDGDRYENLIKQLQSNQNKLSVNIAKQNSISTDIINKFDRTIQQMSHNENLLQSKISQIAAIVERQPIKENAIFIKDTLNQITNMYEIINSVLQDIENSLSFVKLNVMHPSIIKTADLYNELLKLQSRIKPEQLPFEITLKNTLLIEKIINIECYLLNNKITYLLHVPIMYPNNFDYYHLFSIPIPSQSQFKAIMPNNKYLLKSELYYAFESDACTKIKPRNYICKKLNVQEVKDSNVCEVQLLNMKNTSICQQIEVTLSKPMVKQLEKSTQWIGIFPTNEIIKLKCNQQEEIIKVNGTYLINIPIGCQIIVNQDKITNDQHIVDQNQPILFPELDQERNQMPLQNYNVQLENIQLDELQNIKNRIMENQPQLSVDEKRIISHVPSAWTVILYILLIVLICYFCYIKLLLKRCNRTKKRQDEEEQTDKVKLPDVQLPRILRS